MSVCLRLVFLSALPLSCLAADTPLFERDVLPIFTAHCLKCHGLENRKAELDLRTPPLVFQGGMNGAVVVKGSAEKSVLFQRIALGAMPPGEAKKLRPDQIDVIRRWIDGGAEAARSYGPLNKAEARPVTGEDRQFWSFRKLARPQVPAPRNSRRVRNPIDAFVLARLEEKKLTLAPEASRQALIRRAYFDLIGLPPSPDEVDAFVRDKATDAWERLLDRLLASPHFGERWGRHWLDAAGYVDALGLDHVVTNIVYGEGKWRYRDYVVRSFNADKPYDLFLTEQLAGDELYDWRSAKEFSPKIVDALVATGFLRTAADDTDIPEVNTADIRYTNVHQTVKNVTSNILGLTVGCAQCHSHKYDPISHLDYYQFMAVFAPALNAQSWLPPKERALPDVSAEEKAEIDRHNGEIDRQIEPIGKKIAELRRPYEERLLDQKLSELPEAIRADLKAALATAEKKRTPVERYLVTKFGAQVKIKDSELFASMPEGEQLQVARLDDKICELKQHRRSYGKIQALYDVGPPPPSYLFRRGNYDNPGPLVQPALLTVLSDSSEPRILDDGETGKKTSGRRLALARALTDGDSRAGSLVARVFVNRVWQHLYGEGIVATADNFGRSGSAPTHPELLEWLAGGFIDSGWRIKPLIRLMMTASAYRQASAPERKKARGGPDPETIDPANALLWRARLRRLEAEVIRDAVLAVSGKLNREIGGEPVPLAYNPDGMVRVKNSLSDQASQWRRSLYLFTRRNYNLSLLSAFDHPVMNGNCVERNHSAVVLQSLAMMNDKFVVEQAEHFGARIREAAQSPEGRIQHAFRAALGRWPDPDEVALSLALVARQRERYIDAKLTGEEAEQKAWTQLGRMMFNTNEFLYLE